MNEQNRIYKWYLIIAIVYSCIAILGSLSIVLFKVSTTAQLIAGALLSPLILGMFVFNIVMFIVFIVKKIEKIAWLLSGLYIFDFIFSAIVGFILLATLGEAVGQSMIGNLAGIIFPIITLIIAIKLIKRP